MTYHDHAKDGLRSFWKVLLLLVMPLGMPIGSAQRDSNIIDKNIRNHGHLKPASPITAGSFRSTRIRRSNQDETRPVLGFSLIPGKPIYIANECQTHSKARCPSLVNRHFLRLFRLKRARRGLQHQDDKIVNKATDTEQAKCLRVSGLNCHVWCLTDSKGPH